MKIKLVPIFILTFFTASCAHHVSKDYKQYLQNNSGEARKLTKVDVGDSYVLSKTSIEHSSIISSFTAGAGNTWVVKFEDIIDATLNSVDYRAKLGTLKKVNSPVGTDKTLKVDLLRYDFEDHRAKITMNLLVMKGSKVLFEKQYQARGKSQGGKMFWAGAFGMKNAIQQSTMYAINQIFNDFTADFKKSNN
jgi:hypothetical protein